MKALGEMGTEVIVGIGSTKLIGIFCLAFAPSRLFQLYYFRVYLFMLILGTFNGIFFFPVLLSWIGPPTDEDELEEHKKDKLDQNNKRSKKS